MHVIITGGLGFIGSNIASRFCHDGHRVSLIARMSRPNALAIPGADVYKLDLLDDEAVESLDLSDADCMIHLAGPSSGMETYADPVKTIADGYRVTLNALRLAARVNVSRVLNASSVVVYGNAAESPVAETAPSLPISHYGIGKFCNERLVEIFCRDHAMRFNQLRFFTVYGQGQDFARMSHGLVSIFLSMLMKGPKVTSKGSLRRFRDIVHVDDVVEACVRCAASDIEDGPLNVGSGEAIYLEDIIKVIADELGILNKLEVEVAGSVPGDFHGVVADISRLKSELNFTPKYRPEQGLRSYTRWVKDHEREHASKTTTSVYSGHAR